LEFVGFAGTEVEEQAMRQSGGLEIAKELRFMFVGDGKQD
jgi:hypothetical protein